MDNYTYILRTLERKHEEYGFVEVLNDVFLEDNCLLTVIDYLTDYLVYNYEDIKLEELRTIAKKIVRNLLINNRKDQI